MYFLVEANERLTKKLDLTSFGPRAVQIVEFDGESALLTDLDGRKWFLSQPEPLCLGLLSSVPLTETMTDFCRWWLAQTGENINICRYSARNTPAATRSLIGCWVSQRLFFMIDELGEQNKALFKQNRQLRQSYDALQSTFNQLESRIVANRLQTPIMQFETNEISTFWQPDMAGFVLRQTLPILASRLSYLELNFRAPLVPAAGQLSFTLRLEPKGSIWWQWQVPYANLRAGWNGFPCPVQIGDLNEVVLECRWSTTEGAPAIGLSDPHWDRPYGAIKTHAGHQVQTLAMRLWSSLPGVRPPSVLSATPIIEEPSRQLAALPPSELALAKRYEVGEAIKCDFPLVSYFNDQARLQVHPLVAALTIAELPSPLPEGTTYVSTDARTISAEGPDIEYALMVVLPEMALETFAADIEDWKTGFSGWTRLKALEFMRLELTLDRPTGPGNRLYLITRLPAGERDQNAWATFGGVEIGIGWAPCHSTVVVVDEQSTIEKASRTKEGAARPAAHKAARIAQILNLP